jgi:hypothetical protein
VPPLWVAALVLTAVAWLVYRPALNRVFLMDQVWYFAELGGNTSLADGLRHYDYAASRQYWKGDDALFRPLLFGWLAVNNSLFSYHHVAWNVANLALHVLVALALFRLLVTIRRSTAALPVAVLFTVLTPPLELVIWNHLGGYLLACLFLTLGLAAFVRLSNANGPPGSRAFVAFAASFGIAVFCHEAMVPIAFVAAILGAWAVRRRGARISAGRLLALFSPVLVFMTAYLFHASRVARLTYVDRPDTKSLFESGNLLSVLPRSLEVLAGWYHEMVLPTVMTFEPRVFERMIKRTEGSWSSPLQILNVVVVVALVGVIARGISSANLRRHAALLVLLPVAVLAYAGVICLGRPQREVLDITYYLYPFGLLLVTFGYALVDIERLRGVTRLAAAAALSAFILLHGTLTLAVTRHSGRVNYDASSFLRRVSAFVDQHKAEPDFTFTVALHPRSMDPEIPLKQGYPDDPAGTVRTKYLTQILFAKYYRDEHPKHVY